LCGVSLRELAAEECDRLGERRDVRAAREVRARAPRLFVLATKLRAVGFELAASIVELVALGARFVALALGFGDALRKLTNEAGQRDRRSSADYVGLDHAAAAAAHGARLDRASDAAARRARLGRAELGAGDELGRAVENVARAPLVGIELAPSGRARFVK
jgi:hypothetical protein